MPSTSKKQRGFMEGCKENPPKKVVNEYVAADRAKAAKKKK